MTLYFADEVPLETNKSQLLSDSAPLLDDSQSAVFELPKPKLSTTSKEDMFVNKFNRSHETEARSNEVDARSQSDQDKSFTNGPSGVMVKLLTSLRHLPLAMHSVLVVTTLTWVCFLIESSIICSCEALLL